MASWEFWVSALCLALGAALFLLRAAQRGDAVSAALPPAAADLAVYKDQLAEVARDLSRGTIGPEEAGRLRAEVSRRLLEADRASQKTVVAGRSWSGTVTAVLILTLILPGAGAIYWALGAPGYPDMALRPRLEALDRGIANRPGQEAELAALGISRDAALDAQLTASLSGESDPVKLRTQFLAHFEADEMQAAVRTAEQLITLLGADTEASDHANLAVALVAEAGGYVSPEAEAQLRETLSRDMSNELARYLVGEMFLQGGRYDQTFRFWRPIAESGSVGPWVPSIRAGIEEVARQAGIRYSLPDGESGPTAADAAAADEMSPEDRQAMIEGMVTQLADRLATEGGSVEDWNRLIRSLVVLNRMPEAQAIYNEAKIVFAGQVPELSFLRLAAVESGLTQ